MSRVSLWISEFEPASFDEAVSSFFAKKRRRTALKVWKWLLERRVVFKTEVLEFTVRLTGSEELLECYNRLILEVHEPFSYEGMLEVKRLLVEKARELGVNFEGVVEEVEYVLSVMEALRAVVINEEVVVYTPNKLMRFLKKLIEELETL